MNKITYAVYGFAMLIVVISIWLLKNQHVEMVDLKTMGFIGLIQMILSIVGWYKLQRTFFNPYVLFLISCYVFCFGQSLLMPFDAVAESKDLLNRSGIDIKGLFLAQTITLVFFNFMHLGALSAVKVKVIINNRIPSTVSQMSALRYIGWGLFIVSIIPFLLELIETINIVASSGYGGLYNQAEKKVGINNIVSILGSYFLPSLICLYVFYKDKGMFAKRLIYCFLIAFTLVTMIIGGRSEGVIVMSIVLLLYHYYDKEIKFKNFAIISVIGYFFLSFLSVIAIVRTQSETGLSEYIDVYNNTDGLIGLTISEMGGSMFPLVTTLDLVPQFYTFRGGSTYLYALSSIIPNFGFWSIHPAMVNANLGDWLQDVMNLHSGPGYSIVAEAYINFGYYGFIFMYFFGYALSKIMQNINTYNIRRNPVIIVCSLVLCLSILKIPRNSFLALVRAVLYYIVPIYVYVVYLHKCLVKKDSNLS